LAADVLGQTDAMAIGIEALDLSHLDGRERRTFSRGEVLGATLFST
jgi:hypothetical protein